MAVVTTGSLVQGCTQGLPEHLKNLGKNFPSIYYVAGNPDAVLTFNNGSDIAIDATNGNYYMADGVNGATGGSTWHKLGSTA